MRIEFVPGDITRAEADAIVNAANRSLLGGGGVDGAIHRAGGPEILAECRRLRETSLPDGLPTGQAVATTAGRLPARIVIHTVGPIHGRTADGSARLADCYRNSLTEAARAGARSIAFPLISAGAYGWPREDAIRTAVETLREAGADSPLERATLVLFDEATLAAAREAYPTDDGDR